MASTLALPLGERAVLDALRREAHAYAGAGDAHIPHGSNR